MKPKKKQKKLRITEADFMLANRRAARLEEIAEFGRPVSFRKAVHKSKKVYDRKTDPEPAEGPDDVLVKFLLNENETTIPVKTDCPPFYHWEDVKRHWEYL